MAILSLTEGIPDLKSRLERIVVAFYRREHPVRVGDLYVHGAAAILLKDALMPNLVQTLEGTPAFVHGGPFANIAHGHSSVLADRLALGLGDLVVTEAGFGADLGGEKFVDLVCRQSGLRADAAVLVASVRALKHHGGVKKRELAVENLKALEAGFANLDAHIKILQTLGLTPVVAVNRFATDTDKEVDGLPICIAKTQLSLSDDERVLGAPTGWTLEVRGIRPSAGAGFLVVIAGDIMRMPGLGEEPAALSMDIDDGGHIKGLF